MIWYVFDLTSFPEPLHLSLTRAFMRGSLREGTAGRSRLYAVHTNGKTIPARYYLHTADERAFARMIRQFGGRRVPVPPQGELKEIRVDDDPKAPSPEIDTASC